MNRHAKFDPCKEYGDYVICPYWRADEIEKFFESARVLFRKQIDKIVPPRYRGRVEFVRTGPFSDLLDSLLREHRIEWKYDGMNTHEE